MRYKRSTAKGATFFFTLVTYNRQPLLCHEENIRLLREAFHRVMQKHPFIIDACVALPDHLHCIWTLPPEDSNYPLRRRQVKSYFSRHCNVAYKGEQTASQRDRGEQSVWQHCYWEHQIRDDLDMIGHIEYIHYNPVKHGLAKAPILWPYTTFQRYVKEGRYHANWGASQEVRFDKTIGNE